jgi:hypothetical protein
MSITTVHSGRYIKQEKLAALLSSLFGDEYDCQVGAQYLQTEVYHARLR